MGGQLGIFPSPTAFIKREKYNIIRRLAPRFTRCFALLSPRAYTGGDARNFSKSQSIYNLCTHIFFYISHIFFHISHTFLHTFYTFLHNITHIFLHISLIFSTYFFEVPECMYVSTVEGGFANSNFPPLSTPFTSPNDSLWRKTGNP